MADADIKTQCPRCLGTGIEEWIETPGQPPVPRPCSACGATGYREKDKIDITEIIAEEDETEAKIDVLTEKCNDIWDKSLDIMEKCNEIWDKVKTL